MAKTKFLAWNMAKAMQLATLTAALLVAYLLALGSLDVTDAVTGEWPLVLAHTVALTCLHILSNSFCMLAVPAIFCTKMFTSVATRFCVP